MSPDNAIDASLRDRARRARERVKLLVPDLPRAEALLPYLRRIDEAAWYTNRGPLVQEYERACERLIGSNGRDVRCVTASSGTAALELALRATPLPPGSRVLVPAFTFPATVIAIMRAGHQPILCDVDAERWVLTPAIAAASARAHACRAVVPVAAFGVPLDLDGWDALAASDGLTVVIDGGGALGAMPAARRVTLVYSLHATKPLGVGEGGLIATPDATLAERAQRLANYGFAAHHIDEAGTNAKLSEYAAAVGLAQIDRVQELLTRRGAVWAQWREALDQLPQLMTQHGVGTAAPANLVVRLPGDAEHIRSVLARDGIETRRWYCPPVHEHRAFADLPRCGPLVEADRLGRQALGLPFHTRLTAADIVRIVKALRIALAAATDRRPRETP